jgi:hypothetical protein
MKHTVQFCDTGSRQTLAVGRNDQLVLTRRVTVREPSCRPALDACPSVRLPRIVGFRRPALTRSAPDSRPQACLVALP